MDVGAMTVFLHTFTEREKIHNLCESLTGARFTTSYTRIGGLSRDLPPGWMEQCRKFCDEVVVNIDETETLLTRNRIFVDRTQGVGVISREDAIDYGLTGPEPARQRRRLRPAQSPAVPGLRPAGFRGAGGLRRRLLRPLLCRMEEMRQSVRIIHQCLDKMPGGPVNVPDGKIVLPPKEQGADQDGGTDPPFHQCDPRRECAAGRDLFRRTKTRKANWAFTSTAKAAARLTG